MSIYIVDYDLIAGKDYAKLIEAIKGYGSWAKICRSSWAIKTDKTASEVRDNLENSMDSDDKLFVGKLSGEWASYNLPSDVTKWLKDNH